MLSTVIAALLGEALLPTEPRLRWGVAGREPRLLSSSYIQVVRGEAQ